MNCYSIWHVYKVLTCQISVEGNLVGNEIFRSEFKIDEGNGGGEYKQKGNEYAIFSLSSS